MFVALLSRAQPVWERSQSPPWHGAHTGLVLCKGKWRRAFPSPGHKPQNVTCPALPFPHPLCLDLPDKPGPQSWGGQLGEKVGGIQAWTHLVPSPSPAVGSAEVSLQTFCCGTAAAGAKSSTRRMFSYPSTAQDQTQGQTELTPDLVSSSSVTAE